MSIATVTITDYERDRLNDILELAKRARVIPVRQDLLEAVDAYAAAIGEEQTAKEAVRAADEAHQAALASAEWMLDGRFETQGNKTYLITDEDEIGNVELPDGTVGRGPTGQKVRRAMTADERAAWKRREASSDPEVREAARRLQAAENQLASVRSQIAVANTRISALKHALDASVALLNAFTSAVHPLTSLTAGSIPEGGNHR